MPADRRRHDPDDLLRASQQRLLEHVERSLEAGPPECALESAIGGLVEFASEDPDEARAAGIGALAGGEETLNIRDRGLDDAARLIERLQGELSGETITADVPVRIVLGGVQRLLGARLRRGRAPEEGLAGELQDWISRHRRPRAERQGWGGWGRASMPAPGHSVDYEHYFQELMDVTTSAYLDEQPWPERVWRAARAAALHIGERPRLARVGFIDSLTGTGRSARRVETGMLAFTLFLHEGYEHSGRRQGPAPVALEAVAASLFEIGYTSVRNPEGPAAGELAAHASYLALAPFLGPAEAEQEIERLRQAAPG